jgi:hypothetical protein
VAKPNEGKSSNDDTFLLEKGGREIHQSAKNKSSALTPSAGFRLSVEK